MSGLPLFIINAITSQIKVLDYRSTLGSSHMVIWLHRKVCHQILRIEASNPYNYLYLRKAHELVINLLDAPEDMQQHFKTFVPNGDCLSRL